MGVNIDRVIMITFLLGGIMAGGGGLLFMFFFEVTRYNVGFLLGIKAFTAAVLGGIGNLRGALLGGLLLGLIENYGAAIFGSQWKDSSPSSSWCRAHVPADRHPRRVPREGARMSASTASALACARSSAAVTSRSAGTVARTAACVRAGYARAAPPRASLPLPPAESSAPVRATTPRLGFVGRASFYPVVVYVLVGARPQHRRRLRRTARPRVRRLLRHRCLHHRRADGSGHGNLPFWLTLPSRSSSPCSRACFSARRRCGCAATTSRSSRSGFGEIIRITANNTEWLGGPARHHRHPPSRPSRHRRPRLRASSTPSPTTSWASTSSSSSSSSCGGSSTAGSAGPGPRSARTRTPPSSWACPRSSSSCWAFAIGAAVGGLAGALYAS